MTSVMISIKPKWCELIANGQKTVEVRKTKPKLEAPFKAYIYCTKESYKGKYLHTSDVHKRLLPWKTQGDTTITIEPENVEYIAYACGGKVIGEFVCDKYDEFIPTDVGIRYKRFLAFRETCLTVEEMKKYLDGRAGYGWHVSELVIYDKPKGLEEFKTACCDYMSRPPQSWCYCEKDIEGYDL